MSWRSGSPAGFQFAANAFAQMPAGRREKSVAKSCRGSGVYGVGSDGGEGNKTGGFSLAVGHGDLDLAEVGQAADSATLAPPEAHPDVRIEALGLIEAAAEPITEVVTAQKVAARQPAQDAATEPLGGGVDLSPPDIRSC
jgi:hypothetical protein